MRSFASLVALLGLLLLGPAQAATGWDQLSPAQRSTSRMPS